MIDRLRRRSQRALLAVLAYGIALFWVNHIPKVSVPLSGAGGDKVAHFLAYALLAFLLAWTVYPERRGRALGYLALLLGATAYGALRPHDSTTRWGMSRRAILLCCVLLPMIPDADVAMHFWFKYGHPLAHRGISHSLLFAVLLALAVAFALQRFGRAQRGRRALAQMTLAFSLLLASHGITDAMTTGGKPPRLLWPVVSEGVWFPKQFIPMSPMGSSLLRTNWTDKQLRKLAAQRQRVLKRDAKTHIIVRRVIRWSERPDYLRRLSVLGIALTELALLSPFAVLAVLLALWRRRRFGPAVKEPPRTRPPPQAVPDGPPPSLWPAGIALGVAFVAAVIAGALVRAPDAGLSFSSGHLDDEVTTFYRRIAPAEVSEDTPVAVLVHGYRCSHQMMMSLARTLARNGVEVINVDMPGHGRSPIPLASRCDGKKPSCVVPGNEIFTQVSTGVLQHLFDNGYAGRDVVVIGHSTGAVAAHDIGGPVGDALAARIVVEGRFRSLRRDGNRLIFGKKKGLKKIARGLELDVVHGSFEAGDALELSTTKVPHLEVIHHADTNATILRWIGLATGASVGDAVEPHRRRQLAWPLVLAVLGLTLSIFAAAYASRRGWLPPVCPSGYPRPGVAITCMVLGSIAAALWAGELFDGGGPWLQMKMGLVLPTYLMCANVCVVLPYILLTLRPGRPDPRSIAVDTGFAVLVFATLYLTFGLGVDRYVFHVGVPAWRWVRLVTWTLTFLPVSLLVHEVGFASDRGWARVATVLVHALVWAALFWVEAVGRSKSLVNDAMLMVAVVTVAELWALVVGWRRRSRYFSALVSALVLAWVMTAVYPVLTNPP